MTEDLQDEILDTLYDNLSIVFIRLCLTMPTQAFWKLHPDSGGSVVLLFLQLPGGELIYYEIDAKFLGFFYQAIRSDPAYEHAELSVQEVQARLEADCSVKSYFRGVKAGNVKPFLGLAAQLAEGMNVIEGDTVPEPLRLEDEDDGDPDEF